MLSSKHQRTLEAIFTNPVRSTITWHEVIALLRALGAEIQEREGSRVIFKLNDEAAVFHRPHPRPELRQGAVRALRVFLTNAGVMR